MLEIRDRSDADKDDDNNEDHMNDDKATGVERYQELQDIWQQKGMSTSKDFLIYYNNLMFTPLLKPWRKCNSFISIITSTCSKWLPVPGIARRWLFKTAHDAKVSFGLIHGRDDD